MYVFHLLISVYALGLIQLTIHELGHVFTARSFKWNVVGLRLGIGPKVWYGWFLGTIRFELNLIPLSGDTVYIESYGFDAGSNEGRKKLIKFYLSGLIPEIIFMVGSFLLFLKLGIGVLCIASGFVALVTIVSLLFSLKEACSDLRRLASLLSSNK